VNHHRTLGTLLLTAGVLVALCSPAPARAAPAGTRDEAQHTEAFRELEVFEGILENFLTEGRERARVTGHYLAGQGFVFRVEHHVGSEGMERVLAWSGGLAEAIEGGVLELLAEHPGVVEQMPEAFGPDLLGADREAFETLREHARSLRELEREQRSVAREMARRERGEGAAEGLRELEARQEALELEIEAHAEELATSREAIRARQREQREQARAEELAARSRVEDRLVDGLCRFGASLRTLGDDEHVSVILRVHRDGPGGGPLPDRVLTFPVRALTACGTQRLDADGLLARAAVYDHPRSGH
jgi:hypothetical protein